MQVDEPEVWTELGHAQLEAGAVADAIASYLKSGHTGRYADVIARSQERGAHAELVKFLLMVRKKIKEPKASSLPGLAWLLTQASCCPSPKHPSFLRCFRWQTSQRCLMSLHLR